MYSEFWEHCREIRNDFASDTSGYQCMQYVDYLNMYVFWTSTYVFWLHSHAFRSCYKQRNPYIAKDMTLPALTEIGFLSFQPWAIRFQFISLARGDIFSIFFLLQCWGHETSRQSSYLHNIQLLNIQNPPINTIPIGSMYGIFTYMWLIFMINVA